MKAEQTATGPNASSKPQTPPEQTGPSATPTEIEQAGGQVTPAEEAQAEENHAEEAPAAAASTNGHVNGHTNGAARPVDLAEVWTALQAEVRQRVQPEQFETWFRRSALQRVEEEVVELAVQNSFAKDWLTSYYREVLEDAVANVLGSKRRVELSVDPELTVETRPSSSISNGASVPAKESAPAPAANGTAPDKPGGLLWNSDITLNPRYTFDNFVVGPCNRFAYAASLGAAESPGKSYNPLFLHGSVGLGKTHLLQSACFTLLERDPETRILYLSCETFVNHFISALENGDLQKFRHKYRNVDVLVVDDIHLLANKERTQEEFFHTFNTLYNAGKQIVLSSDSPPKDIPTLQERLVSRFKWGLVTEMEPPCYETRMAILKRKGRERGQELPDGVARLLAEHIDSNIRELEGAVTKLLTYASLSHESVTPELAREVLRDVFTVRKGQPSMDEIVRAVTERFGVKVTDLQSRKRTNAVAYPRQIAMYLARKVTRHSLEEIGGFFGGRDHSTVLYAVEKITTEIQRDPSSRDMVEDLLAQFQQR